MKWLNYSQIVIVLAGFVAVVLTGGGTSKADFTFGEPVLFDEPVNSTGREYFDCISADGLELYVERTSEVAFIAEDWDIYVSTRETTEDPWSVPVSLGPTLDSDYTDYGACLSGDGLELYFASKRPGGHGSYDIWVASRLTRSDPWAAPVNLGPMINTVDSDREPWITPDGLELYFSSRRPGGYGLDDIWVATRSSTNDMWSEPVNLGPVVNSWANDSSPCLSSDGLVLFFSEFEWLNEWRSGGQGLSDLWMTRRKSTADPWEPPVNLGKGMNTNCWDSQPRISPDGSVLYFTSSRPDSALMTTIRDIWQAPIIPIVDFNGDGIVDAIDMCIMVDYWGTDNSLCDIGSMPWGDGIIDVEDMKVLAEHLFTYPGAVAYWKLDETEGNIAYNSAADCDGTLIGGPIWQPDAGMVAGALQFDGIDDYVVTDYVLDPADGPFSVFAWVKEGAIGQTIISQQNMANWLTLDAEGNLITELKCTGRSAGPLYSETFITDGQWHRIGLVWDGSHRILYVDDVVVADDTQHGMVSSETGLYIGAGQALDSGTFFSGLIDDVRIYNRAVRP
jgi:hypothetical protein